MSGTTSTWVGGNGSDWTTPANWTGNVPDDGGAAAIVSFDDGAHDAIISNGSSITVGALNIEDSNPAVTGEAGGHVIVGGSSDIGGDGDGTLAALGTISVTSTNSGGGLVGGLGATITAPTMIIGSDAVIGGGGTFNIGTIENAGTIQADGGLYGLGTLSVTGSMISGSGNIEVDGSSALNLNATTSEQIAVNVASLETATIVLDSPASFTGGLNLINADSHVNLFLKNQTPTGATYDSASQSLIITDAGGTIDTIPFISNGTVAFSTPTSSMPGFGEVSIGGATDALPPAPTNLALAPASDSGVLGDNTTDVALPTFTGTGEVGDTVALLDGGTSIGTGTVDNSGTWSIAATTPLTLGANAITAIETNSAGNTSAPSSTLNVTLATTPDNFNILDTNTNVDTTSPGTAYTGPVSSIQYQYTSTSTDNLNITALVPNAFIYSGSGEDGIDVSRSNGNNIIDGGIGSTFMTGGTGDDTFYVDDQSSQPAPVFSTILNFHSGDNATVWGANPTDFTMLTLNNEGAAGYTGLDLLFTEPGRADVSFVLTGYSSADLTNGRLSLSYGTTSASQSAAGSQYLTVHAN